MEEKTLYDRLGDDNLKKLVNEFYDRVFVHPLIGRLFNTDKETIKEKQRLFLTQFLGGPPLYTEKFGHPRLRARHLPHPIDEHDATAWLSCMSEAITTLPVGDDIKDELFKRFIPTAMFMVNRNNR